VIFHSRRCTYDDTRPLSTLIVSRVLTKSSRSVMQGQGRGENNQCRLHWGTTPLQYLPEPCLQKFYR
jgi:hypothetical protein